MATKMVSLRLDEELVEWASTYAEQRGVSRTELLENAIANFREDAEAGVPDLRQRVKEMRAATAPKPGECSCPILPPDGKRGFSQRCPVHGPPGEPGSDESRAHFDRVTRERSELFAGLTAPDSVRFGVKREGKS